MFTYTIFRDSAGNITDIRLTGLRKITDGNKETGVTVRIIKSLDKCIPELDASAEPEVAWKTFASLSQDDTFAYLYRKKDGKEEQPGG